MSLRILVAGLAAALALAACSQKDPAKDAIEAAENALNAVYDDASKYVPERYAEVKAELVTARKAFDEERYADAIAAVKDVPAHAEQLAREATAAKAKRQAELNADWARLSVQKCSHAPILLWSESPPYRLEAAATKQRGRQMAAYLNFTTAVLTC